MVANRGSRAFSASASATFCSIRLEDSSKTLEFCDCSSVETERVTRDCFCIAKTTARMTAIAVTMRRLFTIELIFDSNEDHFKVNFDILSKSSRICFNNFCYNLRSLTAAQEV